MNLGNNQLTRMCLFLSLFPLYVHESIRSLFCPPFRKLFVSERARDGQEILPEGHCESVFVQCPTFPCLMRISPPVQAGLEPSCACMHACKRIWRSMKDIEGWNEKTLAGLCFFFFVFAEEKNLYLRTMRIWQTGGKRNSGKGRGVKGRACWCVCI